MTTFISNKNTFSPVVAEQFKELSEGVLCDLRRNGFVEFDISNNYFKFTVLFEGANGFDEIEGLISSVSWFSGVPR